MKSEKTGIYALRRIYETIANDSDFGSYEGFAEWSQGKYRTNYAIYKLDLNKPHSEDNSYFYHATHPTPDIVSEFCKDCTRLCVKNGTGCKAFYDWWKEKWDKNICIKPKEQPKPGKREFFQYEHPDLVREGIV